MLRSAFSPKRIQIMIHHSTTDTFAWEIEIDDKEAKRYIGAPIPDLDRESTQEAITFSGVQSWWATQVTTGCLPNLTDHANTLRFLYHELYSFRNYTFFSAEYADVVRVILENENKPLPCTLDIYTRMRAHAFFSSTCSIKSIDYEITRLYKETRLRKFRLQEKEFKERNPADEVKKSSPFQDTIEYKLVSYLAAGEDALIPPTVRNAADTFLKNSMTGQ